jgi:hypothetical protein
MSGGWIKVHRKILDNDWLCKSRTYSNFEAFMFIMELFCLENVSLMQN